MKTSEQINELATALAKAQGELEGAQKDSANPFFKSKYADLASVWDACRVPLSKNGLAVIQLPRADGNVVVMETRLVHSSGQWIEGELVAVAKDDGPQSIGSVVTYLRRYMLQAVTGVAPEDDDGNAGQGEPQQRQPPRSTKAQKIAAEHNMKTGDQIEPPSDELYRTSLDTLAKYTKVSELVSFSAWIKEERIKKSFTPEQYRDLDRKTADKLPEVAVNAQGFEAAEKLLRGLHHEMRIDEAAYGELANKLEDAKEQKMGAAA